MFLAFLKTIMMRFLNKENVFIVGVTEVILGALFGIISILGRAGEKNILLYLLVFMYVFPGIPGVFVGLLTSKRFEKYRNSRRGCQTCLSSCCCGSLLFSQVFLFYILNMAATITFAVSINSVSDSKPKEKDCIIDNKIRNKAVCEVMEIVDKSFKVIGLTLSVYSMLLCLSYYRRSIQQPTNANSSLKEIIN
ncbi:uncharacterized protein LOC105847624 [Hydra vulgaris]|uniref:uncharacterized protein LOC105847624 n=1 Tax=Hydra vulgaris TaxID=6087 RepID=UPI000640BB6A|nr:uncharacterized protein LOC105847624 [Hydra vulgaris]